jgi:hypothetical protein
MDLSTKLDIVSTISTTVAVLVALGLGVIPGFIRQKRERKLATDRSHNVLKLLKILIKEYRLYNPEQVIQNGVTQYQYNIANLKGMAVNIDLQNEIQNLINYTEHLNHKTKESMIVTIDLLSKISSGFPYDKSEWDLLEERISESLSLLGNNVG